MPINPTNLRRWLTMCAVAIFMILGSFQLTLAQDSKSIKESIERMESTDLASKSEMVRDIYRRSLLRLYGQYLDSLQLEIKDLKSIQANVVSGDSRLTVEITENIRKLQTE